MRKLSLHGKNLNFMDITVIGHICLDVIHNKDGEKTDSYGGIFYTIATLANLLGNYDKIYPVFGIGSKDYQSLIDRLGIYKNVDVSGIYKYDGLTNHVHLIYNNDTQRIECSKNISPPIPYKKIKPYLDTNMVLINMVSGFDITLETLDEIRMAVREEGIPIYFDLHSLSLGINEDGQRYKRPLVDWRRWFFMLNTVQMNEEETKGLILDNSEEDYLIKQITALNTENVIITRSSKGCSIYWDDHKKTNRHDIAGEKIDKALDSTGCGDVFGAAYCAKFLKSKNKLEAVEFANKVAAFNAQYNGSIEIDTLNQFRFNKPGGNQV